MQFPPPVGDAGTRLRGVVIVYHSIGRVPRSAPFWNGFVRLERFEAQMAYLARRRRVVTLDDLLGHASAEGPPRVAITFDDGYRNVFRHAVPVLRRYGFPAAFFVPTGWIGSRRGWKAAGDVALELMDGDELVELEQLGFSVESHGDAHIDYARSEPQVAAADVRASVERLAELLGHPPRYLAYPYGRASEAAAQEAARLGLRAGFALDRPQDMGGDFALPRVAIVPADRTLLFALKTGGRYGDWRHSGPVRAAYRAVRPLVRRRWLWP